MTPIQKRNLAQLFRQVAAGTISLDQLEDVAVACDDGSLLHKQIMSQIDDLAEHPAEFRTGRFRGRKRLDSDRRQLLARFALFLYTNADYKWPVYDGPNYFRFEPLFLILTAILASVGMLGAMISPLVSVIPFAAAIATYFLSRHVLAGQIQKYFDCQNSIGNYAIWPFRYDDDYALALKEPPLLNGVAGGE